MSMGRPPRNAPELLPETILVEFSLLIFLCLKQYNGDGAPGIPSLRLNIRADYHDELSVRPYELVLRGR
jgi:hypothetical protein